MNHFKNIVLAGLLSTLGCVAPPLTQGTVTPPPANYDAQPQGYNAQTTYNTPVQPQSSVIEAGCSFDANKIDGHQGTTAMVNCPSGCAGQGSIYGSNPYTSDTNICNAAIHAGVIGPQGGMVQVQKTPGRPAYRGTTANGLKSYDYGKYRESAELRMPDGSMPVAPPTTVLSQAPIEIEAGCSFRPRQIEGHEGTTAIVSCPAGCAGQGTPYGSNPYTNHSNVCNAAIHAGIIGPNGGRVMVQKTPGRPAYRGSTANGIKSRDYGQFRGSAQLSPAP